jgi:hypothetical protein
MHTKDRLAKALREADMPAMADLAETGLYDDFLSSLDLPQLALMKALDSVGTPAAAAIRARVINGEFDATKEESDAWAASPEGQEIFRSLGFKK